LAFQSALITGASSGIGAAFAHALPRSTALLLTGRDRDRLNRLAQELGLNGRPVRAIVADLANVEGRQAVIGAGEHAKVDLVINNAGIGRLGRVVENPPEREAAMVQVNVAAPVEITSALLPGMIKRAQETGTRAGLINVASIVAFGAMPYFATYAASKAFLLNYTEALAEEMDKEPIDILALCPGATQTQFFERACMQVPGQVPLHSPEQVAQAALRALGHARIHVVGPTNYLTTAAMRLLPRRFSSAIAEKALQRWK
jgi:uncharacterized protein